MLFIIPAALAEVWADFESLMKSIRQAHMIRENQGGGDADDDQSRRMHILEDEEELDEMEEED
jgi:hypothetical protein